ncbi:hypothetical protein DITRI_Ditri15bG0063500 [Diplodiscus trichospermus]
MNAMVNVDCALVAEARAVMKGLNLAVRKNYSKVILETNSSTVASSIVCHSKTIFWKIWPLVKGIREKLKSNPEKRWSSSYVEMQIMQLIGLKPKPFQGSAMSTGCLTHLPR